LRFQLPAFVETLLLREIGCDCVQIVNALDRARRLEEIEAVAAG
jgi:hypothetical protein